MPKLISKLSISALILLQVFTLAGCGNTAEVTQADYIPKVKTVTVAAGLSSEIQTTGEIQAQKSVNLTAEVKANVVKVFVKNGDSVAANQILATLSSDSVSTSVSTAQSAYSNASSGVTQTGLSVEKNIEAARIALSTVEINLANTLNQTTAFRRQAEEALNSAKLNSSLSSSAAETSLENSIRNAQPTAQNAVAKCDEIVGVSEIYKYSNDTFEDSLGAFKNTTKPAAETAISNALNALLVDPTDYASARSLLSKAESAATATIDLLNNSTTGSTLTQTALSGYIASITGQLATIRGAISSLDSAKRGLESAQQSSDGQSQTVISAQANYEATLAQINSSEAAAKRAVESAKAALASAERGAALNQVGAKSSLDAARGGLQQAVITADKLTIRAPFAGKVSGVSVEAGDEVNVGSSLATVEDPSNLKIVANLSGNEIRKVQLGGLVKFGSSSSATITSIAPSADPLTKKYKVEIATRNPYLKPGEFLKLHFQLGEVAKNDQRIFLPLTAINILTSGDSVWKVVEKKAVKTPVALGDIEGEYVEILSGVSFGDEVIVEGGRILDLDKDNLPVEVSA
ncbi:MAG: efflux RND transporter periplasmic adaptor subunit [Candidatus Gracilibacteria bacterium]|nr:efflux RND transporter periplasmic adaptor subunit [Candidatus Gracilibacteria bacterium]MDD5179468.1 efflux RND transporter periplasmic adaptor subunit [Candidatus Gracilibacteria bacterium]